MIFYDQAGREVPQGRVRKVRAADFLDATIPAWLTNTGTITYSTAAQTVGYAELSNATAGGAFGLTSFQIKSDNGCREIEVAADQLFSGSHQFDGLAPSIDLKGTNVGLRFYQSPATQTTGRLQLLTAAGPVDLAPSGYQLIGVARRLNQRRNLRLRWMPLAGEAFVMEDDQVVAYYSGLIAAGQTHGIIRAGVSAVQDAGVSTANLRVGQLRVALVHN